MDPRLDPVWICKQTADLFQGMEQYTYAHTCSSSGCGVYDAGTQREAMEPGYRATVALRSGVPAGPQQQWLWCVKHAHV